MFSASNKYKSTYLSNVAEALGPVSTAVVVVVVARAAISTAVAVAGTAVPVGSAVVLVVPVHDAVVGAVGEGGLGGGGGTGRGGTGGGGKGRDGGGGAEDGGQGQGKEAGHGSAANFNESISSTEWRHAAKAATDSVMLQLEVFRSRGLRDTQRNHHVSRYFFCLTSRPAARI